MISSSRRSARTRTSRQSSPRGPGAASDTGSAMNTNMSNMLIHIYTISTPMSSILNTHKHGLQTIVCIVQNTCRGDGFKCCIQTYLLSTLTQSSCLVLVEEVGTFGAEDRGLDMDVVYSSAFISILTVNFFSIFYILWTFKFRPKLLQSTLDTTLATTAIAPTHFLRMSLLSSR